MTQIELVDGKTIKSLKDATNDFLAGYESDAIKEISFDFDHMVAVIKYETDANWKNCLCSECQYWDDSGSADAVSGLCQEHGGRKRFNCRACAKFKDIRG